jgi:hypothetical protein
MTTVALQHVSHNEVQDDIDQRCGEQQRECGDYLVVIPCDTTGHKARDDDGNSQPLGKVLARK